MCRILGYRGAPIDLRSLLYDPPHALECQAVFAPLQFDGRGGTNVHGWGVGWWATPDAGPERYRSAISMAEDEGLRADAASVRAQTVIAAVRNASPGAALTVTGNSPFVAAPWLFTHNGFVDGFRDGLGTELTAAVTPARRARIEGDADSETVFALLLDRLDRGEAPADALGALLVELADRAPASRLNFLLGDGRTLWATRWGNSLFTHLAWHGGRVVASEPFDDDPGWVPVPDGSLVTVTEAGCTVAPIPGAGPPPTPTPPGATDPATPPDDAEAVNPQEAP